MSIRWRWALSLGLVAAVAVGLTTWAATLSAAQELRGAVNADLQEQAAHLQEDAEELADQPRGQEDDAGSYGDPESNGDGDPHDDWHSLFVDPGYYLQIFDQDGAVVLQTGPANVILPVEPTDLATVNGTGGSTLRDVQVGNGTYRMITGRLEHALRGFPSAFGYQIGKDMSPVDANLAGFTRRMVPIGIVGILLVGLTGWALASRAVRPIADLTEAAEQIAATERLEAGVKLDRSAPGEIGRLAAAFASMLSSLSASRREQQRLVSDAGHEFRTPITALKTNLETLLRQDRSLSDAQRNEIAEAALTQSDQLGDLATELVDLATDVHHHDESLTEIDLGELAADVAQRFRGVGDREVVVSGEGAALRGRRSQLERALGNLVDNAVKWSSARVEIDVEGGTVTVIDDGPGIPESDLPNIFRRFYRSRQARPTPGSGLGLAIVEHLVTAHGGTVFARNRAGGGAEVGFNLQVKED